MYAVLEQGLKANPNHPDLLYEKATILYSAGDVAGAETVYRQVLRQVPDHIGALNNLAASILDSGKEPESARPLVERARAKAPNDPSVLDTYGWFLLRTGDRANAIRALESVAKAIPKDGTVQYHLGAAYLEAGKQDEGRAKIQEALRLGLAKPDEQKARALLEGSSPR
jgi:Flp pilus assembly protein TadD